MAYAASVWPLNGLTEYPSKHHHHLMTKLNIKDHAYDYLMGGALFAK